jgi:hypothetical protein
MKFLRRFSGIVLILCLMGSHVRCAPLLQLPILLLMIPFKIIAMTLSAIPQLLALGVKYAPLALLFVSNKDQAVSDLETYVKANNATTPTYCLSSRKLQGTLWCYQLESLCDNQSDGGALAGYVEEILKNQSDARIFFTRNKNRASDQNVLFTVWKYMDRGNIKVASDETVLACNFIKPSSSELHENRK